MVCNQVIRLKLIRVSQSLICFFAVGFLTACTSPNESAVKAVLESESLKKENKFAYDEMTNQCINQDGLVGMNTGSPGECVDSSGKDLYSMQLSAAILRGANFEFASLKNSDLSNADLTGANFENADLSGANLSGAIIKNVNFKNVVGLNVDTTPASNTVTSPKMETVIKTDPVVESNIQPTPQPPSEPISETIISDEAIVNQPSLIENLDTVEKIDLVLEKVEASLQEKVIEQDKVIDNLKEEFEVVISQPPVNNTNTEHNSNQNVDQKSETQLVPLIEESVIQQPSVSDTAMDVANEPIEAPVVEYAPEVSPSPKAENLPISAHDNASTQIESAHQHEPMDSNMNPSLNTNVNTSVNTNVDASSQIEFAQEQKPVDSNMNPSTNLSTNVDPVEELKNKIAKEMKIKHELKEKIEKVNELKKSDSEEKKELAQELKTASNGKK